MTGPGAGSPPITCQVCGTENPATRQFCRKCASDLRAPAPTPGVAPIEPSRPTPLLPIVLGGGLALLAVAILGGLFVLLNAGPGASPSAAAVATATAAPLPTPAPTDAPADTSPPVTEEPTPEPEPTADSPEATPRPPRIRSFVAPDGVPCGAPDHSGFIEVSWEIRNATGVTISIDGPGIYEEYEGLTGRRVELPFSCNQSHTYLLTTVGGVGPPATRELTVEPIFEEPSPTGF